MKERKYYHLLSQIFILLLILANIAEIKICDFFGFSIGAGTIVFPLIYVLNDIITEVYGFTAGRKTIMNALYSNCLFSLFLYIIILLPPSRSWDCQVAFTEVFSLSPRIVIASIISYFIGELLNSYIIANLKIKFQGSFFALRAIGSTFISSILESLIFSFLAFYGRLPLYELLEMIILLSLIKVTYEIIIMPFTLRIVNFLKKVEGNEIFEKPTIMNFLGVYNLSKQ